MKILERSPDHKFTYSYSQPPEYRFCLDSIIFARFVADRVQLTSDSRVLDLCAGCGVIGFEIAHYLTQITDMDFIEIQPTFVPHFEANCQLTRKNFRLLQMNYRELLTSRFENHYDLIVAQSPYFLPQQGKHSPVEVNQRARFFMDSDYETLLRSVKHSLHPDGEAYLSSSLNVITMAKLSPISAARTSLR